MAVPAMADIPKFKLNTGAEIPAVGLGTSGADDDAGYKAVLEALKLGYRLIDTALIYKNEPVVGRAIRDSGVPREEIFVTTKAWPTQLHDPEAALNLSLERLGLDYVDLYLVHWPIGRVPDPKDPLSPGLKNDDSVDLIEVWEKFQKLSKDKAKAIGVANYTVSRLEKLLAAPTTKVVPAVNQVELHLTLPQTKLVDYAHSKGIVVEAFSPLARGNLDDPVVEKIAKKHNVDVGQVALSWNVQRDVVVIPKSVNPQRLKSNLTLVKLDAEDLKELSELGKTPHRIIGSESQFDGVDLFDNNADSY